MCEMLRQKSWSGRTFFGIRVKCWVLVSSKSNRDRNSSSLPKSRERVQMFNHGRRHSALTQPNLTNAQPVSVVAAGLANLGQL